MGFYRFKMNIISIGTRIVDSDVVNFATGSHVWIFMIRRYPLNTSDVIIMINRVSALLLQTKMSADK